MQTLTILQLVSMPSLLNSEENKEVKM